mgnify:FL=1
MNNSLTEVHPELVSEWSEKNLTLTPDDITFGSIKKYGGEVLAVMNGRQALRLVLMERNVRYVPVRE